MDPDHGGCLFSSQSSHNEHKITIRVFHPRVTWISTKTDFFTLASYGKWGETLMVILNAPVHFSLKPIRYHPRCSFMICLVPATNIKCKRMCNQRRWFLQHLFPCGFGCRVHFWFRWYGIAYVGFVWIFAISLSCYPQTFGNGFQCREAILFMRSLHTFSFMKCHPT